MGRASVAKRSKHSADDPADTRALVPPPIPGGTETQQSLGRWIDDLLGDRRARTASARRLAPMMASDDEKPEDPPPSEPPPPIPGGTETITKGARPGD
ncbi:MAG: hypothetical protein ACRDKG_16015 [Actinomycetota bacterium]